MRIALTALEVLLVLLCIGIIAAGIAYSEVHEEEDVD